MELFQVPSKTIRTRSRCNAVADVKLLFSRNSGHLRGSEVTELLLCVSLSKRGVKSVTWCHEEHLHGQALQLCGSSSAAERRSQDYKVNKLIRRRGDPAGVILLLNSNQSTQINQSAGIWVVPHAENVSTSCQTIIRDISLQNNPFIRVFTVARQQDQPGPTGKHHLAASGPLFPFLSGTIIIVDKFEFIIKILSLKSEIWKVLQ